MSSMTMMSERPREWINLFVHEFIDIGCAAISDTSNKLTTTLRTRSNNKRKRENNSFRSTAAVNNERPRATVADFFWRYKGSDRLPPEFEARRKPVERLDLKTGEVLASYDSVADAAAVVGGDRRISAILGVCSGQFRSSAGYFWRFVGSNVSPPKKNTWQKPVEKLDLKTGEVLASFESVTTAAASVDKGNKSTIQAACAGRYTIRRLVSSGGTRGPSPYHQSQRPRTNQ